MSLFLNNYKEFGLRILNFTHSLSIHSMFFAHAISCHQSTVSQICPASPKSALIQTWQYFSPSQYYQHFVPAKKTKHAVSWTLWMAELTELSKYFGQEETGFPHKHKFPWKPNQKTENIHFILGPGSLVRHSMS